MKQGLLEVGRVFGRLKILGRSSVINPKAKMWTCQCICGKLIEANYSNLVSGTTQSCGCKLHDTLLLRNTTHGVAGTQVYRVWMNMKARCLNEDNVAFHNYGGRGITVCDRWLDSFENFLADMGKPPTSKHTIERVENDLGYAPGNCVWAERKTQARNTRRNRVVLFNGESKPLIDWCDQLGIPYFRVHGRITKLGWSTDRALSEKGDGRSRRNA